MSSSFQASVRGDHRRTRTSTFELGGVDFRPALFTGQEPYRLPFSLCHSPAHLICCIPLHTCDERSPFGIRLHGSERSPFGIKLHGAAADVTRQRWRLTLDLASGNHWSVQSAEFARTFLTTLAIERLGLPAAKHTTYNKLQRAAWLFGFPHLSTPWCDVL